MDHHQTLVNLYKTQSIKQLHVMYKFANLQMI